MRNKRHLGVFHCTNWCWNLVGLDSIPICPAVGHAWSPGVPSSAGPWNRRAGGSFPSQDVTFTSSIQKGQKLLIALKQLAKKLRSFDPPIFSE